MRILPVISVFCGVLALYGCTRSSNALNVNTQAPPQPLPSAPSGQLQSAQLEQLPSTTAETAAPTTADAAPSAPTVADQQPVQTAALDTTQTSAPISHEGMTGAWNVNSDSAGCRVFLSFTKWEGGYRAGTRQCSAPELSSVSAWDVKNNKVLLIDRNGAQVATLGSAGSERYAGALVGGKPITFSR
jgi:hypothetical protein